MADSSEDEAPIIHRLLQKSAPGAGPSQGVSDKQQGTSTINIEEDEEEDKLPQWATLFKSPYTGGYKPPLPSSSDDDILDLTKDSPAPASRPGTGQVTDTQPSLPAANGADLSTKASPRGGGARGRGRGRGTGASRLGPIADTNGSQQQHLPAIPETENTVDHVKHEPMQIDEADQLATQIPDSQLLAAAGAGAAGKAGRGRAAQLALPAGAELPIMLPEKVPRNKVLVELPAGGEGAGEEVVDLAGDAGAVGRLLISGSKAGEAAMVLDLKGVMFDSHVRPLQGTALVLNIQPAEAKVEAVLNDFVQLHVQAGSWNLEEGGEGGLADLLGEDDEDHYIGTGHGAGGEEGEDDKQKKKSKKGGKQTGGGGKGAGGKARGKGMGVKGGVLRKKKPATKAKAAGTKKAAKPKAPAKAKK